ncbi:MAG TPA: ATP-binding protein [Kofleriaceae bacterium]|nr:ATP-binding protein [Kofleriaceae bacterium]
MGARVRAFDWSRTALGPVEGWPQSLRTAIGTCLESRFPILIWWGRDFVKIYNDAYAQLLGDKHPHALGQNGREVWPEIWDIIGPMLQGVLERGQATWSENQMLPLQRSGFVEECYFTFSYSPIREASGEVGGVFTVVTEVTAQVLGQRRLDLLRRLGSRRAVNESDACTTAAKVLASASADVTFALIYLLDDAGQLSLHGATGLACGVAAAPSSCAVAGAPWRMREALASDSTIIIDAIDPALGRIPGGAWPEATHTVVVQRFMSAGKPLGVLVTGISPRLRLDEPYRSFLGVLADQLGNAVTAARSFDEERRRAEALAAFDRAKTKFFSNVSHEFRTPLTLLMGPMQNAQTSTDPALRGADLDVAYRNAQRLLKLVNQLLDFSRIEAKRMQLAPHPTDLGSLTADLASAFRSAVEQTGIALNVDCPPLLHPVQVDPEMWEKIVLNLLSNAFKFTFTGAIDVVLVDREDHVELVVRDTGVGIPPGQQARVFERFHRVEGSRARTHEGSGIGLSLVRDLITLHGGAIELCSEVGVGTTFTVTIPRVQRDATGTTVTTATGEKDAFVAEVMRWLPDQAAGGPQLATASARILVADDNADMREYLRRLLSEQWRVDVVSHGKQALEAARERPPDLVVSDVMMPELDGFGLLAELRADPRTATIPVVLLSARAGEEAIAEGLRAGADDYIVKPFTASNLLVRIEAQLATSRARAEQQRATAEERRRLYSMLMDAPAAFASLRGPNMIVELANQAMLRLWGWDERIVGRPFAEALPESRDQQFPELLHQVLDTGIAYTTVDYLVRLDSNRDGNARDMYFDFTCAPSYEVDGTVAGVLVFAVDVTQRVIARRELEQALRDSRTANETKDEFLALLGHELRNPLAPILTALGLMELRGFSGVKRECDVIARQTEHLSRLVDDLLDVARIARGKVDLDRVVVDLADVVVKSVELASPLFEQKQHHLEIEVPRGLIVEVDQTRIAQVLSNLLTNAAKYTERRGSIGLHARAEGAEVVVRVTDNGIGLAREMLPRVFDMFVQERQAIDRSRGGLGLGLTIVKSLVLQHGGSVAAHSEGPGRGATFEVRLPLAERPRLSTAPASSAGAVPAIRAKHRVLIVDDNEDAALLLAEAMGALGHETRVAHDGPGALKIVEAFTPEIALLDIGLPVMDGYELGRLLRNSEHLGTLRLVAVTGYGQPNDRRRSEESGFDAHIVKPVDTTRIGALLDQLL